MNNRKNIGTVSKLIYRMMLACRVLFWKKRSRAFGVGGNHYQETIEGIYVINLDSQNQRWIKIQQELDMLRNRENKSFLKMTKRFSAIDARNLNNTQNYGKVTSLYALGDQLFVEPQPALTSAKVDRNQYVKMSQQEIAVALSHIAIWKKIAKGDQSYVLIVEDDVYFTWKFFTVIDQAWPDLVYNIGRRANIDILYLSYEEAKGGAEKEYVSEYLFKPQRGLWNLSGYVLSKRGANKLLELLPISGPVDLWINHQFNKLDVYATSTSIIEQRSDYKSNNLYSILPVLSKLGVLTQEGASTFQRRKLPEPIFGIGSFWIWFDIVSYGTINVGLSMLQ